MKRIIASLLFLMFASTVLAWEVPARPFGLEKSDRLTLTPAVGGENDLVLIPTASLGYGVGPSNVPSYGYSGAYDLVFGDVTPSSTVGTAQLTPYIGAGLSLYVDMGPWINSALVNPILADGGFNVIGPQINGLVPSFQMTWNFQTGEKQTIVNLTVPFAVFSNSTIIKVFGL